MIRRGDEIVSIPLIYFCRHDMNFGERLKQLRAVKNLTQKQLAIETETSERGIQNYEMGIRKPAFDVLIALADYFDVSLDYLVGRSDDPTRR